MKFAIMILIRFSVCLGFGFKKPAKEYVLSDERLAKRFNVFEHVCLPSLKKQENKHFKVIFIIDTDLNLKWRQRLENDIRGYDNFIIHEWSGQEGLSSNIWLKPYIPQDCKYIVTSRLDDDDGLHPEFVSHVKKYIKEENRGAVITFPLGVNYSIWPKGEYHYRKINFPLLACGLTKISSSIEDLNIYGGSHCKIHEQSHVKNIIKDLTPNMYVVTDHDAKDSQGYCQSANIKTTADVSNLYFV